MAILEAVLTVVGLVWMFPLIPVGLGLLAIGLIVARFPRAALVALDRLGRDGHPLRLLVPTTGRRGLRRGAPPYQLGPKLAFQASVILIAAGLAAIGLQLGDETSGWARRATRTVSIAGGANVIPSLVLLPKMEISEQAVERTPGDERLHPSRYRLIGDSAPLGGTEGTIREFLAALVPTILNLTKFGSRLECLGKRDMRLQLSNEMSDFLVVKARTLSCDQQCC